jgi:hypothetical protein
VRPRRRGCASCISTHAVLSWTAQSVTLACFDVQDVKIFKRRRWRYLILDEAHMIKNWKSMRWQALLNFSARHRLLITGTPLQNDLMELWSLLHFLMPHVFSSHAQFQGWFSNPLTGMVEGASSVNNELVGRLHSVLRPFVLRRMKQVRLSYPVHGSSRVHVRGCLLCAQPSGCGGCAVCCAETGSWNGALMPDGHGWPSNSSRCLPAVQEVEKQLPGKTERIVMCKLSRRQRTLYDDFLGARSTKEMMASGSFISVMNVLMQLRKVCNHPDLFEGRAIVSALDLLPLPLPVPMLVAAMSAAQDPWHPPRDSLPAALLPTRLEHHSRYSAARAATSVAPPLVPLAACRAAAAAAAAVVTATAAGARPAAIAALRGALLADAAVRGAAVDTATSRNALLSADRCTSWAPILGSDVRAAAAVPILPRDTAACPRHDGAPDMLRALLLSPTERFAVMEPTVVSFTCVIPAARAPPADVVCASPGVIAAAVRASAGLLQDFRERCAPFRASLVRRHLFFPDRNLVQFDCGALAAEDALFCCWCCACCCWPCGQRACLAGMLAGE